MGSIAFPETFVTGGVAQTHMKRVASAESNIDFLFGKRFVIVELASFCFLTISL